MAVTERRPESPDTVRDSRYAAPAGGDSASLGMLVSAASRDLSSLVRDEIALAKAEMRADAKHAARGGGLFGAAALCGLLAVITLSFAAAYGIHAAGLGLAWSWLIVGGAYLVLAGIAALVGKTLFGKLGASKGSVRSAKESVAMFKQIGGNGGEGH